MQDPSLFSQLKFPEQEQLKCPRCDSMNTKFCYYNNYNLSQPRHFCKNCRRYWTKGGTLRNIPVGGGTRKNTKRSSSSNTKRSSSSSPSVSSSNINNSSYSSAVAVSSSTTYSTDSRSEPVSVLGSINSSSNSTTSFAAAIDPSSRMVNNLVPATGGGAGIFSSLLGSNGQFGDLLQGLNQSGGGGVKMSSSITEETHNSGAESGSGLMLNPGLGLQIRGSNSSSSDGGFGHLGSLQNGDLSCWGGGNNNNGNGGWPDLAIYAPGSSFH